MSNPDTYNSDLDDCYNVLSLRVERMGVLVDHIENLAFKDDCPAPLQSAAIFLADYMRETKQRQSMGAA